MFRRTSSEKWVKKIKFLMIQKRMDQEVPAHRTGTMRGGTGAEDIFVRSLTDSRLTAEGNAVLVHRLLEVREAFAAMLLSNREASHDRDFWEG